MTAATLDPGKRSRANTRARLMGGARAVFTAKGFPAASVEDVCRAAGFSRGAFYSNFASMDDLFLALWDDEADRIIESVASIGRALADTTVGLDDVVTAFGERELYGREWFVLNTEFLLHATRDKRAARELSRHRRRLRSEIGAIVAEVLATEGRRLPDDVDLETFTRLIIAGHEGCQAQTRVERSAGPLFRTMLRLITSTCPSA